MTDDLKIIEEMLTRAEIIATGTIVRDEGANGPYYIFVTYVNNADGKRHPSATTLNRLKADLAAENIRVEFALTDAVHDDIEAGLRATLVYSLGDYVRNVFTSISKSGVHLWIEEKKHLDEDARAKIKEKSDIFLGEINLSVSSINSLAGENTPSNTAITKTIRQFAPASAQTIQAELSARGHSIPSESWLNRRLDALRKNGDIVRLDSGEFVLTLQALDKLRSRRGRASPDVARMLALARRGS